MKELTFTEISLELHTLVNCKICGNVPGLVRLKKNVCETKHLLLNFEVVFLSHFDYFLF